MMSFQVGDVVQLNSGGPKMTVTSEAGMPGLPGEVRCIWFDAKGDKHSDAFVETTLRVVPSIPPVG